MTSQIHAGKLELRVFATAASIVGMPLFAAAASAEVPPAGSFVDPVAIDQAVTAFTGAAIGEVGGARTPADRRLRLAACATPLGVDWHGSSQATVKVTCAGPQGWRIFVALRPAPQSEATTPAISRGDPITVAVRGRGFTVQQSGEAMENGRMGDWIAIRTSRDAAPVRARIERPGLAIIPAD